MFALVNVNVDLDPNGWLLLSDASVDGSGNPFARAEKIQIISNRDANNDQTITINGLQGTNLINLVTGDPQSQQIIHTGSVVKGISIDLGGDNDEIEVKGNTTDTMVLTNALIIYGRDGNDKINVQHVQTRAKMDLIGGNGVDTMFVKNVTVNNFITGGDSSFDFNLDAGPGGDIVDLTDIWVKRNGASAVGGDINVIMGSGNDTLTLNNSTIPQDDFIADKIYFWGDSEGTNTSVNDDLIEAIPGVSYTYVGTHIYVRNFETQIGNFS
jgi:hypothetical protein